MCFTHHRLHLGHFADISTSVSSAYKQKPSYSCSKNGSSIKEFQHGLHQQIEKLETCLSAETEKEITYPGNENLLLTSLKLKRYFQTIDDFLKENQYSRCAGRSSVQKYPDVFSFLTY
ncbi:unnamed protein product [Caretta caretta]